MIGVHDKTTHKVTLRHAPLHVLIRDVKALKSLDPLSAGSEEREKSRNLLGEAFGSKKAKQAIRAMERNRVDVSAMEGVASHLQGSIEAGTESLPSKGGFWCFCVAESLLSMHVKKLQKWPLTKAAPFHGIMSTRSRQMR